MSGAEKRNAVLVCLCLAVAVVGLYWPAHEFAFIQYDDNEYVFDNPEVRHGLSWWGLVWAFVDGHAANYHPLTWHVPHARLPVVRP